MPGDTRKSLMVTNAVNIFLIVFFIIFSVVIVVIIQNLTLTYQWQKFYQNRYWKGKQKLNPFVLAKVPRDTFDGWRWSFSYLGRGVIVIVFNSVQGQRFKDLLWDQVCTSMNCDIVSHAQKLFTSYSLCPVSKGSIAALANWPPLCTFCTTRTIISSRVLTWKWPTHSLSQFLWKVFLTNYMLSHLAPCTTCEARVTEIQARTHQSRPDTHSLTGLCWHLTHSLKSSTRSSFCQ